MMTDLESKKTVSTKKLTMSQLLIYYPIAIYLSWINPPHDAYEMTKNVFLKTTGIQIDGIFLYMFTVIFLINVLVVFLVFKVFFHPSKFTYGGKNGWHSVWWSFSVQTGIYIFIDVFILTLWGLIRVLRQNFWGSLAELFLSFLPDIIVFFLGTVGCYALIRFVDFITNKKGE